MTSKLRFKPVDPSVRFPKLEEEIIKYWKENKIFEKSLAKKTPKGEWTFLDGPPFITGLPHYGSLLSSIPKDLFPRYKTMNGWRVRRVWGWDCHGLPAENKVEEKLGIKRKKDIEEKIGVKKFIDDCKLYVKNVSSEWEWYVDHVGRWVDFKNAYKTMDLSYMETVVWVFKQMYEKGYIYKGLRVSLYCPHCATPISNFEVAMDADNYQEIAEPATTYKYQLKDEKDTYLLAWSTTPWNKLVTSALAVNPKLRYVKVSQGSENYILAKSTLKMLKKPYKILQEFLGKELIGRQFIPHYDFYQIDKGKKAFIVVGADFVTAEEGTGIVTLAAYGEEDLATLQKENIQVVMHLDEEGMLKKDVPKWGGMYYLDVNKLVNADLAKKGLIYKEDSYSHTVPRCWRCQTRLIYAPQNAWYVNVQILKDKLRETNETVNWFPEHFKYGRYLKSLENAPDWCISRSRYWGSPVPVWECPDGHRTVPGSIKELEGLAGQKIIDLHKPEIDEVTIKCDKCQKQAKRVPEVLDSWIEAGSAPYAERHYPFEKGLDLKKFFPPDFITEYTGQIRAWFYVLHVIATALFDSHAFKNVLVSGVILGTDGRKMSKNYNNYPDPKELLQKYGGDALRLYLMGSPVMRGEDISISEVDYRNQARGLMTLWNIYNFFVTYANMDGWTPSNKRFKPTHILDRWILSRLNGNIVNMTNDLENFDTVDAVGNVNYENTLISTPNGKRIVSTDGSKVIGGNAGILINHDLSNWYIRRMRDRVGPTVDSRKDKNDAYQTLWTVLTEYSKTLAPFIPFITEEIYQNLTGEKSVHISTWPTFNKEFYDDKLEIEMYKAMNIASKAHSIRKEKGIKVRQPLASLTYGVAKLPQDIEEIVALEVNVKKVIFKKSAKIQLNTTITPQLQAEGEARELVRQIQQARKDALCRLDETVTVELPTWPKGFEDYIKKETLAAKLVKGTTLKIIH